MIFQIMSQKEMDELPDIPYCPLPEKRLRTDAEEAFLELQRTYHGLLGIPAKQRSDEEKKEVLRLRKKYSREKAKFSSLVVEKQPAATGAQRKAKSRQNRTEEEEDYERAANREREAQPEALAAARARKARPEALEANRARMQARRQEPGQPKTFMEARRTLDIFSGELMVH